MIFGKGYITYNLFFVCAATVAMTRFVKRDYKKVAEQLDDHYSDSFLDKGLKNDFLKAGDHLNWWQILLKNLKIQVQQFWVDVVKRDLLI